jgi:hypothetical protein
MNDEQHPWAQDPAVARMEARRRNYESRTGLGPEATAFKLETCPGTGDPVDVQTVIEGETVPVCSTCGMQFRLPINVPYQDPDPEMITPDHMRRKQ